MSSACLDEATILAVGRGTVQGADRLPIEEHVAGCDECRSLVSAVARGSMLDLVAVLGESASPKPPSVTVPRADSQAISERVAREVPQSGIEHAAAPLAEDEDGDDDDAETNRPPMANPLAVSRAPDPPESLSTTPEIIPSPKPAPEPAAAIVAAKPNGVPLWLVVLFVVLLAATAAMAAVRFVH